MSLSADHGKNAVPGPSAEPRESGHLGYHDRPAANWMSRVPDDVKISDLSIPGTHESCARFDGASAGHARCQDEKLGFEIQLHSGIRYVDIRCRATNGIFAIHHGPVYQKWNFGHVLQACWDFLQKFRSETVLMRIQQEYSNVSQAAFQAIFNGHYGQWHYRFHISSTIPTLGEVRGKIVLISGNPYLGKGLQYTNDNTFDIQDLYNAASPSVKKPSVTRHLDKAINAGPRRQKIFINHTSANNLSITPWGFARELNPYTRGEVNGKYAPGRSVGVIAMDYWNRRNSSVSHWENMENTAAVYRMNRRKPPAAVGAGKRYVIWSKATGAALDATDSDTLVQWEYHANHNQEWELISSSSYPGGTYSLEDKAWGRKIIWTGTKFIVKRANPHLSWRFIPAADGAFQVQDASSGKYLYAGDGGELSLRSGDTSSNRFQWFLDEFPWVSRAQASESQRPVEASVEILSTDPAGEYTAQVTVVNTTEHPAKHWSVVVTPPDGVTIDTAQGADISGQSTTGDVRQTIKLSCTNELLPGQTADVEYTGRRPGPDTDPTPVHLSAHIN